MTADDKARAKRAAAVEAAKEIEARFSYEGVHEAWIDPRRYNELRSLALLVTSAFASAEQAGRDKGLEETAADFDRMAAELRKRAAGTVTGEMGDLFEAQRLEGFAAAIRAQGREGDDDVSEPFAYLDDKPLYRTDEAICPVSKSKCEHPGDCSIWDCALSEPRFIEDGHGGKHKSGRMKRPAFILTVKS